MSTSSQNPNGNSSPGLSPERRTEILRLLLSEHRTVADLDAVAADLLDEIDRIQRAYIFDTAELTRQLDAANEDLRFARENTIPQLERTVEHHFDGKTRWRKRAVKAEGERARYRAAWGNARNRAAKAVVR